MLADDGNLIRQSRYVDAHFSLSKRKLEPAVRRNLEGAFSAFEPDIIVPCDEHAVAMVNHWVGRPGGTRTLSSPLLQCLARSLGALESLPQRACKAATIERAKDLGVVCPRQVQVRNLSECQVAAEEYGYPVVLKLSHGTSGEGVRICSSPEELRQAYASFRLKQIEADAPLRRNLRTNWFGSKLLVLVQEHVAGQPGMSCASAVEGVAASVVTGLVEANSSQTGPASVVRLVNQPSIIDATIKMIGALSVTGFVSFDFIVDLQGQAHLLECNPRPTKILHVGPLFGVELAGSLLNALQGKSRDACETPTGERTVAFRTNGGVILPVRCSSRPTTTCPGRTPPCLRQS